MNDSRERFRAWNSAERHMYYDVGINPDGSVFDKDGIIEDIYGLRPTVMQVIGIRDKHGKAIFEGDILKGEKGGICVVEWEEQIDRDRFWATAYGFSINFGDSDIVDDARGELEVIGNHYENADLVESIA